MKTKKINLTIAFVFVTMLAITFSCTKDNFKGASNFSLKQIDGSAVKQLPYDLLPAIHADLIKKGRPDDANRLYELYDLNTGILKGYENQVANAANGRTNSQYAPQDVFAYVHQEAYGDIGPYYQASSASGGGAPDQYAGVTGQSKRLEGMWLQTSSQLVNTRPVIYYALRNPDLSYTTAGTWGQFVGTRGQYKAVIGLKMWTTTPNFSIWYKAHNAVTGWNQPWENDGLFSGVPNARLEAFGFYIMQY